MVVLKNVWKRFCYRERGRNKMREVTALQNISFSVPEGEIVGIVGASGAGKTSLLKVLCGLLKPEQGLVRVMGTEPVGGRKKIRRNIAVLFTGAGVLEPGASVEKNLEIAGFVYRKGDREVWEEMKELCALFSIDGDVMKMSVKELSLGQKSQLQWDLPCMETFELLRCVYGVPKEKYKKIRDRLVELLDMGSFLQQPVRQLSLGQRMRADIVASLLHSPEIVFFDEPTIGVDVVGKETIRNFICELNKGDGVTMLFTTHDMQDIEKTCKRLIIINKGAKEYDGSLEGIRRAYSVSRQIEVEFLKEEEIAPIEHVEIKNLENRKKRFVFDSDQVKINDIMTFLFTHYDIRDLQIVEPEIEGIIRKIYSGDYQRGGMA